MKIGTLFHLLTDASDLLDFFDEVESPDQLVSRLERLKRGASEELLSCIVGLRASLAEGFEDTVETGGTIDDDDDKDLLGDLEKELEREDSPPEDTSSPPTQPAKDETSDSTPAT